MHRKLFSIFAAALLSGASISLAHAAGGLYLGAGVGNATIKDSTSGGEFDASAAGTTTSKTGTDPFYGVGVGFQIWKLGIRAEYEKYKVKDIDNVQMYSLSALFQF